MGSSVVMIQRLTHTQGSIIFVYLLPFSNQADSV
uniref:Uncharacterized protein n=1 Tax=Arundo donax TaxID=35708 RepID=A0A0A8YZ63_ARUDO